MILGGMDSETGANRATIDELFRRAGVRHPDALALADPPNRDSVAAGAPRQLTYAQADRAISALATRLRLLGLATDAVVAMQLANTVESVITLLGVLRAGMIAAPLPLLWRKQDMAAALRSVGAKAIVTSARIGSAPHVNIAMEVAADVFAIRHVCGFGQDLPDGVVPLDDCVASGPLDFAHASVRAGNAAAHVAVVTFDVASDGLICVARNHRELIAGGMAALLEAGIAEDAAILSAIPLGSFAGIALTLLPWLLSGGVLALHHGFDADAFAEQCRAHDAGAAVLPGAALTPLAQAGLLGDPVRKVLALWRTPERLAACAPWYGVTALTDVASFGEVGLLPARRGPDGMPAPIPCGAIGAPRGAAGAVVVAETSRTKSGMLGLRGPMVPMHAFPPGLRQPGEPHIAPNSDGFVDTGFACRCDQNTDTLTVTGPPAGITAVGGYRFRQNDVDWLVAEADPNATMVALPDALLGQRFAGGAPEWARTSAELQARGANPLIAGAFRARPMGNAA